MPQFVKDAAAWQAYKERGQALQQVKQQVKRGRMQHDMTLLGEALTPEDRRPVTQRLVGAERSDSITHPTRDQFQGREQKGMTEKIVDNLDKFKTLEGIQGAQQLLTKGWKTRKARQTLERKELGETTRERIQQKAKTQRKLLEEGGKTREVYAGDTVVQQQFDPTTGEWSRIGQRQRKGTDRPQPGDVKKRIKGNQVVYQKYTEDNRWKTIEDLGGPRFSRQVPEVEGTDGLDVEKALGEWSTLKRQADRIEAGANIKTEALGENREEVAENLRKAAQAYADFAAGNLNQKELAEILSTMGPLAKNIKDPSATMEQYIGGSSSQDEPGGDEPGQGGTSTYTSADAVKQAYKNGELSREEASRILQDQFGYGD